MKKGERHTLKTLEAAARMYPPNFIGVTDAKDIGPVRNALKRRGYESFVIKERKEPYVDNVFGSAGLDPDEFRKHLFGIVDSVMDDETWFAAHPKRTHRIRAPSQSELGQLGLAQAKGLAILIRKTQSGEMVAATIKTSKIVDHGDEVLEALFDSLSQSPRKMRGDELKDLAEEFRNSTSGND